MAPLLGLLLLLQQASIDPRAVVEQAVAAVEADSVPQARAHWVDRLTREHSDPAARLALATLERLTYRYPAADSSYHILVNSSRPSRWRVYARLGLAELERVHRSLDSAAAGFSLAAAEAHSLGDQWAEADALLGLALAQTHIGPARSALATLGRARRLLPGGTTPPRARLLCTAALLKALSGKDGAGADAEQGLGLARTLEDRRLIGTCWLAKGVSTFFTNDNPAVSGPIFDSAETWARRAKDLAGAAEALYWSGLDQFSFLKNAPALQDFEAGRVMADSSGNRLAGGVIATATGATYWRLGDFPRASLKLQEAVRVQKPLGDLVGLVNTNRHLANVAFALGRLDEAEQGFRAAREAAAGLGDVVIRSTAASGLAFVSGARGDWRRADSLYRANQAYLRSHNLTGLLPGTEYGAGVIALHLGDLDRAEDIFRRYLKRNPASDHQGRYQVRARLAAVFLRRGKVNQSLNELTLAIDQLDSLRSTLSDEELRVLAFQTGGGKFEEPDYGFATLIAAYVQSGYERASLVLSERRRARELLDRLLRSGAAVRDGELRSTAPETSLASVTPADDRTAYIEFLTGRHGQPTTGFVITRSGIRARVLPPIDSIAGAIDRFQALLEQNQAETARALGMELRRALLDPLLAGLPPATTRVVIIPDDVLHRLAFDALPQEDGRPLVGRYAVAVAPSLGVVARLGARPQSTAPARVLALGDAVFAPGTPSLPGQAGLPADSTEPLDRLEGSAREAAMVAGYGVRSVARLRSEASEAFLKHQPLDSFRVLHFATHALVDQWSAEGSALVLSAGEGEDGFLRGPEIARLTLPVDLVVLSACQTGGGVLIGGEGVQGLTAPLLAAGARAVVVTYWPVRDRSIGPLIARFYQELSRGLPLVDALRQAKLSAIASGAPVSEWAAFTAVGDPLLRVPLAPPVRWPRVLLIGAGLAGLLGLGWIVRAQRLARNVPSSDFRSVLSGRRARINQ